MLSSNAANENYDAGHIKCSCGPHLSHRPQVPHPYSKGTIRIAFKSMKRQKAFVFFCFPHSSTVFFLLESVLLMGRETKILRV